MAIFLSCSLDSGSKTLQRAKAKADPGRAERGSDEEAGACILIVQTRARRGISCAAQAAAAERVRKGVCKEEAANYRCCGQSRPERNPFTENKHLKSIQTRRHRSSRPHPIRLRPEQREEFPPMAGAGEASQLPYDDKCDACEPDEAKEAALICEQCAFSYCDAHAEEHRGQYAAHRLRDIAEFFAEAEETTPVGEPEASDKQKQVSERKNCPLHKQELSLYCKEDSKIICVLCAVAGDHRQHQLITLNEAYQEMKKRKPIDLKLAMGDMVEKLKEKLINPNITRSDLKRFVQKEFDHMKQLVNEEEKRALHFVDLQEAVASAHVTEVLAELNVHMGKLTMEMAEITRQLNSFNQLVMLKPEDPDEDLGDDESGPEAAAEGASSSRFKSPPPGNGPW
ncbi:LOW QUALITY PROTEIN: tripartite motif-containing protein 44 [Mantella aurantiaca]